MASEMKYFWDQTTSLWLNGALHGKPACVFTASGSMHGGQESTLLTMLPPLFHHGMMIMGLSNATPALSNTKTGGTPYGASHVSGPRHDQGLSPDEKILCETLIILKQITVDRNPGFFPQKITDHTAGNSETDCTDKSAYGSADNHT
uniref:NADPH-dependent FMN reductase-like domain-containing protein n=1 Tax=Dendroctonus ponderosae TaxID=77166 RepID=A0AAR5QCY8_DENPD